MTSPMLFDGNVVDKVISGFQMIISTYGVLYVVVFVATLVPATFLGGVAVKSFRKNGLFHKRTIVLTVVALLVWFSPSIVTTGYVVATGANLAVYVIIGLSLVIGVFLLIRKVPGEGYLLVKEYIKELQLCVLLVLVELVLRVDFLRSSDVAGMELVARFRGSHVNWVPSADGPPRELDEYDRQESTTHVAVFVKFFGKRWLIGYGRLLFGCNQLVNGYRHVLNPRIDMSQSVEVSRLVLAKNFFGIRVRGTWLSVILQLMIYRRFFQACEERGVTEWWAVLGDQLHHRLGMFGFPFRKVNDLQGKDSAGVYYVVKMFVNEARQEVSTTKPLLYRWFRRVEKTPVRFVWLGENVRIPSAIATNSANEPVISN
ncbi:hypothetical protein COX05_03840 [candidate division WWE3 bacterium CG22_combo_CG10-13_8_21_14_all_39_12]|uniref:Uncharacterized protein n=2 Tax=Katanobacteria TaxID=422282 RepID=A0A2M7X4L7_UNCKA|nr:MAG: hypothetical protein COX05_03840 [candidate division WWE3 bacterium CG22_combo_CG10-13_8_21_14_all_39_12]PJA41114.1 MAG: hypothetical protein CO179_00625 [candidate division WWE3 bacterium CG_4_9_14_3_um_filter_39_7]